MVFRKFAIMIFLVLIIFSLVSCENGTESISDSNSNEEEALLFRITWTDYSGRGQAIGKIVDEYNENNGADTDITMIGGEEDMASIESLLSADTEMIYVLPYRYVQYFADKGYLYDLTSYFPDSEDLFYPEIWDLGTLDGSTYGIPWLGHSMCLLYNKTLLTQAGVDASSITSLDAFVNAMVTVEAKTDALGIGLVGADGNDISWMVNQFIYGFGGSLVNEDGTTVTINSEESKAALEFYRSTLGSHAQPTWLTDTGTEVMTAFLNQEVAFEIQSIWGVTDIMKNGSPFEVGIISMEDIGIKSEVGPMMLALPKSISDEDKEQAVKFINYLISLDAQEQILNGEYSPEHDTYYPFRTPIRIDMADTRIIKDNPEYLLFIEGFDNPSIDVPVPKWQIIKDEYYGTGLHKVMTGEMDISEFLELIETEGNKILNAE